MRMSNDFPALLFRQQVEERLKLSRSTLYSLMSKGLFPKPIHLSANKIAWLEKDIERWLLSKCSQVSIQVNEQGGSNEKK